ncbi:MAG: HTH domain-containing protein [Caldilineae bacterium]|nr:MAG: HTH domain-containing protein [Caldilineae bacterium]
MSSDNALDYATRPLFDAMAQIFALYGWPEVAGRLYAALFLNGSPLSLDDLAERQGVSKATVSNSLRILETLHLAHRVPASPSGSGGRPRLYYQAEANLMKAIQELIRYNARKETELAGQGIAETRSRLTALLDQNGDPDTMAQAQSYLETLHKFDSYLKWGQRVLWLVDSVERMGRFMRAPAEHPEASPSSPDRSGKEA